MILSIFFLKKMESVNMTKFNKAVKPDQGLKVSIHAHA